MKNLTRILLLTLTPVFILIGCAKDDTESGSMSVRMTDAPGLYHQVNVDVQQILVHYSDDGDSGSAMGWTELQTNAGIYNLLELQNGIDTLLVDSVSLPLGSVSQMRLILGANNSVMLLDSSVVDLNLSSQSKTGLKLNLNATIKPGENVSVLFDFDAEKSVVVTGNGTYQLKPVIKLVSVE